MIMNRFIKRISCFFVVGLCFIDIQSIEIEKNNILDEEYVFSGKWLTPRVIGTTATVAIAALVGLHMYVYSKNSDEEVQDLVETYPYAHAWYQKLVIKYPKIKLDEKQFLQSGTMLHNYVRWDYFYRQIYCQEKILEQIHAVYRKQEKGYKLTQEEETFLSMQEFLLLVQAGHIILQDGVVRRGCLISALMFFEAMRAWFLIFRQTEVIESRYQHNVINLVAAEMATLFFLAAYLDYYQFHESHRFACKHADRKTLEQIVSFLEESSTVYYQNTFAAEWKQKFFEDPIYKMNIPHLIDMMRQEIRSRY